MTAIVHFVDPDDGTPDGASVCGVALVAAGHPTEFPAGPRHTFRRALVTCAACKGATGARRKRSEPSGGLGLVAESFAIRFTDGPEHYQLDLRDDGGTQLAFTLVQETPRETAPGVIDADPCGVIELGADAFIARYAAPPPARLAAVVDEALRLMFTYARPGHVRPSAPNAGAN